MNKMAKVTLNYWPSLLLSLVLLAGIVSCLKRLDYLVNEEIRALISIMFGFVTSCLVLSFIWLVQRRPLARSWPNNQNALASRDLPSMHPRGRANSTDSYSTHEVAITTISNSQLDVPPTYEDALINSKPIQWYNGKEHSVGLSSPVTCCECLRNKASSAASHGSTSTRIDCIYCTTKKQEQLPEHDQKFNSKTVAVDINQNHYNEPNLAQHYYYYPQQQQQQQASTASRDRYEIDRNLRKASFVQLDVSQLILSSSPPKYHELHWQTNTSCRNNEQVP